MSITERCQRWYRQRTSFRPAGERIEPSRFGVDLIERDDARDFIIKHHYSSTFPAARLSVGLFRGRTLVGVAVFSQPMNQATVPRYASADDGCELGRLVLLDSVEGNGETWFLARAFRLLRQHKPSVGVVISYSDPLPRTAVDGSVVKRGHFGIIYRAFNGRYVGTARSESLVLDPGGRVISRRALSKLRNDEQGAGYAYRQLLAAGAPYREPFEDGPTYVARALREGPFRRVRHPGNFTYVWPLRKDVVLRQPALPYPTARGET